MNCKKNELKICKTIKIQDLEDEIKIRLSIFKNLPSNQEITPYFQILCYLIADEIEEIIQKSKNFLIDN